jgi:hypothetical protein
MSEQPIIPGLVTGLPVSAVPDDVIQPRPKPPAKLPQSVQAATVTPATKALKTNVVTQECINYLLAPTEDEKYRAFEHLKAILLTATKSLYIPENDKQAGTTAKYEFAIQWLLEELSPYRGMSEEMILAAAKADKFRWFARRFRLRLINKIRDTLRQNKRVKFVTYCDEIGYGPTRPPSLSVVELEALLAECDFLSDKQLATVWGLWRARDLRGGRRIRAIAAERNVSVQQARKDRRAVVQAFQTALKAGHSGAIALFDSLAKYILPANLKPRDADFGSWWDETNPGTSIHPIGEGGEPIQFDQTDSLFGYHKNQDFKNDERGFDEDGLAENGKGYSWRRKNNYGKTAS